MGSHAFCFPEQLQRREQIFCVLFGTSQAFNLNNKQIPQVLTRPGSSPAFFKYNPTVAPAIRIVKETRSPVWWTVEAGATI